MTEMLLWIGVLFVSGILLELLRMNVLLYRSLGIEPRMPEHIGRNHADNGRRISVVIPAKDEAVGIEECVRSILASDYPDMEVILIDDRSTDNTLEIMNRIAADDTRVVVMSVSDLPEGWTGKTHAMFMAAKRASGDILLFIDADTILDPHVISRSASLTAGGKADMVSILPGFTERGFGENAVYPHMALGLSFFYPLTDVNNPEKAAALASGCFIMITRKAYDRVGTWAAFRTEVTEDVALSKVVKASGLKLTVMRGGDLVRTKAFGSISAVCRFWKRTFYGGLEKNVALIARLTANYAALSLLSFILVLSCLRVALGPSDMGWIVLLALSGAAMAAVVVPFSVFLEYNGVGPWYGLTAPFGIFVSLWVALSTLSAVLCDEGIPWRGSTYR